MQQQKSSIAVNFAASLRAARGDRSQAEFARYLGIKHQQTYQAYESGRVPDGETLHQISVKLGVSIDELLRGGPRSDSEAAEKKVLIEPGEAPWGKELEENTQMTIAIGLFCKHLTYNQLLVLMGEVLKNDRINPSAKVFWVKILYRWAEAHLETEAFDKLSPEEKIAKRKEQNAKKRALMEENGADVPTVSK